MEMSSGSDSDGSSAEDVVPQFSSEKPKRKSRPVPEGGEEGDDWASSVKKKQKLDGLPRETWNAKRVSDWLETTVFGAPYIKRFAEEKVDGKKLASLDSDTLEKDFGVTNKLHRLRFKRIIDQLRRQSCVQQAIDSGDDKDEPLDKSDIPNWDCKQTYRWLDSLTFGHVYKNNFLSYGVDGKTLIRLNDQTLEEELSIDKALVRKRYLRAIRELSPTGSWEQEGDVVAVEEDTGMDDSGSEIVKKVIKPSKKRRRTKAKPDTSDSVLRWNTNQVIQWLSTLDFAEPYIDAFQDKKVNGPMLFQLTHVDLEAGLGVTSKMIRSRFLRDIEKLREENPDTESNLFSPPRTSRSVRGRGRGRRGRARRGRTQSSAKTENTDASQKSRTNSRRGRGSTSSATSPNVGLKPAVLSRSPGVSKPLDVNEVFSWSNREVVAWLSTQPFASPFVNSLRIPLLTGEKLMVLNDHMLENWLRIGSPSVRREFLCAIDQIRPPAPKMDLKAIARAQSDSPAFDVNEWNVHHVQNWLKGFEFMKEHTSTFSDIDGVSLLSLTPEKLTELDVSVESTQELLLKRINSLKFRDVRSCPIDQWDVNNVSAWLESFSFGASYTLPFRVKHVTGSMLIQMTDETLEKELGVPSQSHRKELLDAIQIAVGATERAREGIHSSVTKLEDEEKGDTVPVSLWKCQAVVEWIRSFDFGHIYADHFEREQITGEQLVKITDSDLENQLSISNEDHRAILLKAVIVLSKETEPPSLQLHISPVSPVPGPPSTPDGCISGTPSGALQTTPSGTAKTFVCDICGKAYVKQSTLIGHRADHVGENEPYQLKCMYCSRRFKKDVAKAQHEKTHFRSPVAVALVPHPSEYPISEAQYNANQAGNDPLDYSDAHQTGGSDSSHFASIQHPMHNVNAGLDTQTEAVGGSSMYLHFSCKTPRCNKAFKDKGELDAHEASCLNAYAALPSECPLCKERFPSASLMTQHLATHTQVGVHRPFKCLICNSQFSTKSNLDTHIAVAHPNASQETATRADLTPRLRFSRDEIEQLEGFYAKNNHPPTEERRRIAQQMGIDHNRVTNWFSNRRQKAKRIIRQNGDNMQSTDLKSDRNHSVAIAADALSNIQGVAISQSSPGALYRSSNSTAAYNVHHSTLRSYPLPQQPYNPYQTIPGGPSFGASYPSPRGVMNAPNPQQYGYQQPYQATGNVGGPPSSSQGSAGVPKTNLYGMPPSPEGMSSTNSVSSVTGMVGWEQTSSQ